MSQGYDVDEHAELTIERHRRRLQKAADFKRPTKGRLSRHERERNRRYKQTTRSRPSSAAHERQIAIARRQCVAVRGDDIGSTSTVRRMFLAHGWRSRARRRLPLQKPTDHIYRKAFCWQYRAGSEHVLFSDEKIFDTHDCGAKRAWCGPGELAPPLPRQQFPPSVMVWGVIGIGFRHLVVFPRADNGKKGEAKKAYRMNSRDYIRRCLSVKKVMDRLTQKNALFMQDGAKCHTAALTTKYLRRKGVNFIEKWPRSPQLNPIENMWAQVARAVSDRGPVDAHDLAEFVSEEFHKIPVEKVDALVLAWKGRLRRCHAADGHLW